MNFDPTAVHENEFFTGYIIKISPESSTGFICSPKEDVGAFSLFYYLGKIWRWLTQPNTRMEEVWNKMLEEGVRSIIRNDLLSDGERLEKVQHLTYNLQQFHEQVIDLHNERRLPFLVRICLAGINITDKNERMAIIEKAQKKIETQTYEDPTKLSVLKNPYIIPGTPEEGNRYEYSTLVELVENYKKSHPDAPQGTFINPMGNREICNIADCQPDLKMAQEIKIFGIVDEAF